MAQKSSAAFDTAPAVADIPTPELRTDWNAFEKADLVPSEIVCQSYWPAQQHDMSCHTRLRADASNILNHINPEHGSGGGFIIKLRKARTKDKPEVVGFWNALREAGVEILDIRCDHCRGEIKNLTAQALLAEFKPHKGAHKSRTPQGAFRMTLSLGLPTPAEDEEAFD